MKIDLEELPLLSLRLQIQLEPYGIKLDASKFKAMIKEDNGKSNTGILVTFVLSVIIIIPTNPLLILLKTNTIVIRFIKCAKVLW